MFWKPSVLEKAEGNKDFPFIAKLNVIPEKPSVLCYKKSKQKENRTEGNKGTRQMNTFFIVKNDLIHDKWIFQYTSAVATIALNHKRYDIEDHT